MLFSCGKGARTLLVTVPLAMPLWPQSLVSFAASVLTTRTAGRLAKIKDVGPQQQATWRRLVQQAGATRFWPGHGLEPGISYELFRRRLAPRTHADLRTAIDRMQTGEANVLWPGSCTFFASGIGNGRIVPVTSAMLDHFRTACRDALLYYTARTGHAGVVKGRHLCLNGTTALQPIATGTTHRAFVGSWSAIAALNLPKWADARVYEPGADIAALNDWEAKCEAILDRTLGRDVTLVAAGPTWLLDFAEHLRRRPTPTGRAITRLADVWPNLECYVHDGVPVTPYQDELREALGPDVQFHELFSGSEGVFAAQDSVKSGELRLMTGVGVFYEFLPWAEFNEPRLEGLAERVVPLSEVKPGLDYVVVASTPAGLIRYVTGDVVRFASVAPPRLTYVGRTEQALTTFGERVLERDLTDVLVAVCRSHRWRLVNFHVAPLQERSLTGHSRGRHEWWIELRPGTVETPTGPQMAVELDRALQAVQPTYAERRQAGRLEAPFVRLVMPGVFRHWMRFHHKWDGQSRMARCRNDRVVADELAQITRFAGD